MIILRKRNIREFQNTNTKKIFYTGENTIPDFNKTDYSFSFVDELGPNNYRLPLWVLFINWFNLKNNNLRDPSFLIPLINFNLHYYRNNLVKPFFCSFIASKPTGRRIDFVPKIDSVKRVHNLGRLYSNSYLKATGRGDQKSKLRYMKLFKFNIAFENTISDGYVTEKILHSLFSNSIPIYWGASQAQRDFNPNSFINLGDFKDDDSLIDYLHNNYTDKTFRLNYLNEPVFKNNQIPDFVKPENVLSVLSEIIE